MTRSLIQSLLGVAMAAFLCTSCASRESLSTVSASGVRTITVARPEMAAGGSSYTDRTGAAMRGTPYSHQHGAVGGALHGILTSAIAGLAEGPGKRRFQQAIRGLNIDVARLVEEEVQKSLRQSGWFTVTDGAADAQMRLKILSVGVAPGNGRELAGMIAASARLVRPGSEAVLWERQEVGYSAQTALLEEYERRPALYAEALRQAAGQLATRLVYYHGNIKRISPPGVSRFHSVSAVPIGAGLQEIQVRGTLLTSDKGLKESWEKAAAFISEGKPYRVVQPPVFLDGPAAVPPGDTSGQSWKLVRGIIAPR